MKTAVRALLPGMAAALFAFLPVNAKTISPEEALRLAGESTQWKAPAKGGSPILTYTAHTTDLSRAAYYIYNKPQGGFLILSAEDELPIVLADVDNGTFTADDLPENVKWWLGEYVREIDWYIDNRDEIKKYADANANPQKTKLKAGKENITPFLQTTWSQDAPFNEKCPSTPEGKCVTGCVATAMAQSLKHYNYPPKGFGEHSYTHNGLPRSFDYASTTFEWDNMLSSYAEHYTQEEADAVATLMVACGIGVDSEYATDQTGAVSLRIAHAYREFFGYSPATSFVRRDYTSLTRWIQLIYDEMAAERPVTYSGLGPGGGHEFVADGYREGDLFHINWGWGGYFDGYFRLTALNPSGVGTGGGMGAFNSDQDAVVQMAPPGMDEGLYELTPLYINGGVGITTINGQNEDGAMVRIGFNNGGLYANIVDDMTGYPGVFIFTEYGEEVGWYESPIPVELKGIGKRGFLPGLIGVDVFVPRLEEGTYSIYLGFGNTRLKPQIIPVRNGDAQSITMTVDADGQMNLYNIGINYLPEIEVTRVILPDSFYPTEQASLKLDVSTGEGGYNGYLRMMVCDPATKEDILMIPIEVKVDPYMLEFRDFTTAINVEPGKYEIHFIDFLGQSVSNYFPITVSPDEMAGVKITSREEKEAEYFDLQGRRVNGNLQPGLYIRRQGRETRKITVK